MTNENDNDQVNTETELLYNFTISNHLSQKIKKHIQLLKYVENPDQTIKDWAVKSFEEKLSKEKLIPPEDLDKERFLTTSVKKTLNEKIEQRVALYKRLRKSYSKKQWVVEAMYDKLEKDESVVREKMQELVSAETGDV